MIAASLRWSRVKVLSRDRRTRLHRRITTALSGAYALIPAQFATERPRRRRNTVGAPFYARPSRGISMRAGARRPGSYSDANRSAENLLAADLRIARAPLRE